MTRIVTPIKPSNAVALGAWLRDLRQSSGKTLREVAASAGMDPALLSKIERGNRLSTVTQASALARSFAIQEPDLQSQSIAADFMTRYGWDKSSRKALSVIRMAIDKHGADDAG